MTTIRPSPKCSGMLRQNPQCAYCQGFSYDADERTRTSTGSPRHGPEPCASTNSATSACGGERRYRTGAQTRTGAILSTCDRLARARTNRSAGLVPGALLASVELSRAAIV